MLIDKAKIQIIDSWNDIIKKFSNDNEKLINNEIIYDDNDLTDVKISTNIERKEFKTEYKTDYGGI